MDLVKLTEHLVKCLVSNPDNVSVTSFEDEEGINIEVIVPSDDMASVIGNGGACANAIRTLVQATAYINHMPRVRVNIDSKED